MNEEFNDIKYYRCEICECNDNLSFFKERSDLEEIKTMCKDCLDETMKSNNSIVILKRLPISYGVYMENWDKYNEIQIKEIKEFLKLKD